MLLGVARVLVGLDAPGGSEGEFACNFKHQLHPSLPVV